MTKSQAKSLSVNYSWDSKHKVGKKANPESFSV
jgi:hypothetical protein